MNSRLMNSRPGGMLRPHVAVQQCPAVGQQDDSVCGLKPQQDAKLEWMLATADLCPTGCRTSQPELVETRKLHLALLLCQLEPHRRTDHFFSQMDLL